MLDDFKTKIDKLGKSTSSTLWDQPTEQYTKEGFKVYWETLPIIAHYQFQCMTGNQHKDYLSYIIEFLQNRVGTKNLRGLSIGCGELTAPEMTLYKTGYFSAFDVMDIAAKLLERQEQKASAQGLEAITYIKQDLNRVQLGDSKYDLIWAVGTVHHIENLEDFFDQVQSALTPNGIFVMREYVGPNRIQLTDEQLAITNEILSYLPDKYKWTPSGHIKNKELRVDVDALLQLDPSESVRSQDIVPLFKEKLDIIHLAWTGGTILHPLLNQIGSNFEQDEESIAMLKILIMLERILVEKKAIPSDYIFAMAKKKK